MGAKGLNSAELLLEKALRNWQGWNVSLKTAPMLITELSGGKTNRSFLVGDHHFRAVVRINAERSEQLGICRAREQSILSLLEPIGVAPAVLYCDTSALVSGFVEGRQWTKEDLKDKKKIAQLAECIEQIQSVKMPHGVEPRHYESYCNHYIFQLTEEERKIHSRDIDRWVSIARQIDRSDWTPVICHSDLVPENIVETEQGLILLDWEYADWGHPAVDYLKINQVSSQNPDLLVLIEGIDRLWWLLQNSSELNK